MALYDDKGVEEELRKVCQRYKKATRRIVRLDKFDDDVWLKDNASYYYYLYTLYNLMSAMKHEYRLGRAAYNSLIHVAKKLHSEYEKNFPVRVKRFYGDIDTYYDAEVSVSEKLAPRVAKLYNLRNPQTMDDVDKVYKDAAAELAKTDAEVRKLLEFRKSNKAYENAIPMYYTLVYQLFKSLYIFYSFNITIEAYLEIMEDIFTGFEKAGEALKIDAAVRDERKKWVTQLINLTNERDKMLAELEGWATIAFVGDVKPCGKTSLMKASQQSAEAIKALFPHIHKIIQSQKKAFAAEEEKQKIIERYRKAAEEDPSLGGMIQ